MDVLANEAGRTDPTMLAAAVLHDTIEEVLVHPGHSVRVSATQDLLALNIDLASIMQSGRWKSSRMPMRYGKEILAARGGMARAAAQQGRDGE
jgi:hypothetical protein